MRNSSTSGAPQKPAPRAKSRPAWLSRKRHLTPSALRQPRIVTSTKWLITKSIAATNHHFRVGNSAIMPATTPHTAASVSERYVAHIESIYLATGDTPRRRYNSTSDNSHSAATTTFIGKAKNSTGKSPATTCKIAETTAPTATMATVTRAV